MILKAITRIYIILNKSLKAFDSLSGLRVVSLEGLSKVVDVSVIGLPVACCSLLVVDCMLYGLVTSL